MSQPQQPSVPGAVPAPAATGAPAASAGDVLRLDAGALERLRELDPGGSVGLVARIMAAYAESAQPLVDQLEAGLVGSDLAKVRHAAHTLKSSSASIGAIKFSGMCADIEAMARAGDVPDAAARAREVRAEFTQVLADVQRLC